MITNADEKHSVRGAYGLGGKVSFVMRIVHERDITETTVIEVSTQVWGQAKTYDAQCGMPLVWLLIMTRSQAIDILRSRQPNQKLGHTVGTGS